MAKHVWQPYTWGETFTIRTGDHALRCTNDYKIIHLRLNTHSITIIQQPPMLAITFQL